MAENKTAKLKKVATKKTIQTMTVDQLHEELMTAKSDLLQAKRGNAAGELTNPHLITVTRKKIARLNFAIHASASVNKEKI